MALQVERPAPWIELAFNPLAMLRDPRKELEPTPMPMNLPRAEISVSECIPRVELIEPLKEEEVVVALMEKMLEIDATTPDEDAISKNDSGVTSPSPNLPSEVEAKTNLATELSVMVKSVGNVH